ncbi:hypothetical protein DFH06DRAFT_1296086 [Mycena polygramma]|nr:hypothetical protein DFH06DRAFT_1296086 [Mycena polygramma]
MHPALGLDKIIRTSGATSLIQRIIAEPDPSRFLPVIYANLDPSRILSTDALDTAAPSTDLSTAFWLALGAMDALVLMRSIHPTVSTEVWPRMWIWMQEIENYHSLIPDFGAVELYLQRIVACMQVILFNSSGASIIRDTLGLHAFLGRTWAGMDPDTADEGACKSLLHFMCTSQWTDLDLNEFAEGCGGAPELAGIAVRCIHATTKPCPTQSGPHFLPISPANFEALIGIVTFLGRTTRSKLFEPLGAGGVAEDALDVGLEFLTAAIWLGGYPYLPEALNAGLLDALLEVEKYETRKVNMYFHLQPPLAEIRPAGLAFLPVVSAMRGRIPSIDTVRSMPQAKDHLEQWIRLLELAAERTRLLDTLESPEYVPTQSCDGPQCGLIKPVAEIKRCSGCHTHYYCSIACQTAAWRDGSHRAFCMTWQLFHHRQRIPFGRFSRREEAFVRFIVHNDYLANKLTILLKQLAFVHRTGSTRFATVFRYLEGRCAISVVPLEEISDSRSLAEREYKPGMVHQVYLHGSQCECRCPMGSRTHQRAVEHTLHMRAESSALMDGVVRIAGILRDGVDVERLSKRWPDLFEELRMLSELDIKETHG